MKENREFGMDVIRVSALILVMLTHSIVLVGAYNYEGIGGKWLVTMGAFYLSHSCVPLFLMLSGYLCGKKKLSKAYFRGLFPVLVPYIVISVLCLLYVRFWQGDTGLKWTTAVYELLSFRANGYSWYVEMYLGLFLLIPFLNLLYHSLPSDRSKLALLILLGVMTLLPDVCSSFGTDAVRADILPDYWNSCYPVTYYVLGLWLRENGARIRKTGILVLLGLGWVLPVALCALCSYRSGSYAGGRVLNSFGCLTTALTATALFSWLRTWKGRPWLRTVVQGCSERGFEMYLCSYLSDQILYTYVHLSFPVMTLLTFVCAGILACLVRLITVPLSGWCRKAYDRVLQMPDGTFGTGQIS
jgi:surface polysaccharide O-acyltransferase-like enzyme